MTGPSSAPDLSIVLVNWNALDLTVDALTSIADQTRGIEYEAFVVDNGSTRDRGLDELESKFPWVTLITNQENLGFGRANNQAFERASGRYVLALNTDTIQVENALGEAVRYLDAHPEVGGLGIRHLNDDETRSTQASAFRFPRPGQELLGLLGLRTPDDPTIWPDDDRGDVDADWLVGSFLMVRRETLDAVGVFDDRFFVYEEDIDWCRRARTAGWVLRFRPALSMIHLGSASAPHIRDKSFMHFRSHLTYLRKHHGTVVAAAHYLAMVLRLTLAASWSGVKWLVGLETGAVFFPRCRRQLEFLLLRPGQRGLG
mgnify:CR=1 FL=1